MVSFTFFVHCEGWKNGGYENKHFATNKKKAIEIINKWNTEKPNSVSLLKIEEITYNEFIEDYTGVD